MVDSFLRRPQVEAITGLKHSSIYAKMKRGEFPRPIRVSDNVVAWLHSDVLAWMESRVRVSRGLDNPEGHHV